MVIVVASGNEGEPRQRRPQFRAVSARHPRHSASRQRDRRRARTRSAVRGRTSTRERSTATLASGRSPCPPPGGTGRGLGVIGVRSTPRCRAGDDVRVPMQCAAGVLRHGRLWPGTSQAAPHVTGLVAQLVAKYGKGNPSQIKQLLLNGLDDLGAPGPGRRLRRRTSQRGQSVVAVRELLAAAACQVTASISSVSPPVSTTSVARAACIVAAHR